MNEAVLKMKEIPIETYDYTLPDERIAKYPLVPRDASKLLLYKKGDVSEHSFWQLPDFLPPETFLVFNNTKVIPARLFFQKKTGAVIEIFILNPVAPTPIIAQVMETTETSTWACMIGNKKKWKGEILQKMLPNGYEIIAELVDSEQNLVKFSWKSDNENSKPSFAEIVKLYGEIPLPPYLNRKAESQDASTYQTVYSKHDGAVAAPTAGLHFTENVFSALENKGIKHDFLTLHVGAGTFQPVKVSNAIEHTMHNEQLVFSRNFIENLQKNTAFVIPVGTTSMRSLESLYWFGVKLLNGNTKFLIEKLFPYQHENQVLPTLEESLAAILSFMEAKNIEILLGETEIFIFPSYQFKVCKGIITNFHQPKSTLLLLISALIGENWKEVYSFAMDNNFRFLSYGDSSLLLP